MFGNTPTADERLAAYNTPLGAVGDVEAADSAARFMTSFIVGRAGAMGFGPSAKTNLVASGTWFWRQTDSPINKYWQSGKTIMPAPNEASPTTVSYPMRASDTTKIYESQLLQLQDYVNGTP